MQIVRTIVWVLLLTALLVFSFANWDPTVTVKIWSNLVVETKIPAIVIISFMVGFVPMWLLYRANRWQLTRRIGSLEAAARTVATAPIAPAPAAAPQPIAVVESAAAPVVEPQAPLRPIDPAEGPPPGL
ncbi:MAG: DUF1049 domain-containing protein [Croceibacterium sp.]